MDHRTGMSQVMTIILTTVIATMIAAIVGLSAGDIIPGAFEDTGEDSCVQQIQTQCQTSPDLEDEPLPASCRGVDDDVLEGLSQEIDTDDNEIESC